MKILLLKHHDYDRKFGLFCIENDEICIENGGFSVATTGKPELTGYMARLRRYIDTHMVQAEPTCIVHGTVLTTKNDAFMPNMTIIHR